MSQQFIWKPISIGSGDSSTTWGRVSPAGVLNRWNRLFIFSVQFITNHFLLSSWGPLIYTWIFLSIYQNAKLVCNKFNEYWLVVSFFSSDQEMQYPWYLLLTGDRLDRQTDMIICIQKLINSNFLCSISQIKSRAKYMSKLTCQYQLYWHLPEDGVVEILNVSKYKLHFHVFTEKRGQ